MGAVRLALVVRLLDEWWSYLPGGTIADLNHDLGVSYTGAGWLLALLSIGGLAGGPIAALADRGHRRLLASAGALTIAAALAAFAVAAPFAVLAVAAFGAGGASDVLLRPIEAAMAEAAGDELDRAIGRQHLITWLGDAVGPALLALGAATALGWRGAFAVTAAAFVAFAAVIAMSELPDPPAATEPREHTLWRHAITLARDRTVLAIAAAELCLAVLDEPFLGYAVARLSAAGHPASSQILAGGLVAGGVVGAAVVARSGLGHGVRRVGPVLLIIGAFAAAMAPPSLAVQSAAMAVLGLGTALVWARVHHAQLSVAPGLASTAATVVSTLSTPGWLLPIAVGVVADRRSLTSALVVAASASVPLAAAMRRIDR